MPINYEELMALKSLGQNYAYTDRDVMLYAYGIGLGADPMDERELAYVNEGVFTPRPLKVVPTFASVAAWGAGPGDMKLNRVMVVDGERDITFHKPFPSAAKITADSTVLDAFDKGKDKGAVIRHQTVLKDENGDKLATLVASRFARGDGGFGGPSEGQPEPHPVPGRAPDKQRRYHDAARSGAGLSPLRRPQPAALRSGICQERPASQNRSCTACAPMASPAAACCRPMPITIRRPSGSMSRGSPHRSIRARSSPWSMWKDGNVISFEAKVKSRGVTVIKNGKTVLG